MAQRRFVKKLPGVLQTEVQKEFYAATFDQVFNPANVESAQGFIGRRTGDVLDPSVDNYLEEPTKNRAAYQLEPIAYAVNAALQDTNQFFYEDILNYIRHKGGNISNHDRLFADNYYSFSPPIDVDKYLNYQNYLWLPGNGTDPTNTAPVGYLLFSGTGSNPAAQYDAIIESLIIGAETFNTSQDTRLVPQNFEFTSGMRIQFVGSASYNRAFYVEGVGRGIRLVEEEQVVYPSTEVDIIDDTTKELLPNATQLLLENPDYITVERGSVEGSAWARSNRWFHEDSVDAITSLGQLQGGTIVQGGNGYSIGDVLLVNVGDGTGGSFVVTSVALGGVIDGIAVFSRGSGYNFAIVDETGVASPLTQLQWDNQDPFGLGSAWDPDNVISNPSAYLTVVNQDETDFDESIIGGSVALGGSNYTVGDTLTIVGGTFTTAATFNVDSVDPVGGAVTGISIISGGSYSAIPTTPAVTTGGTGLGCSINLSINGTFDGGSAFLNPADLGKFIALSDGSVIRIDNVVANAVTEFTLVGSSTIPLPFSGTTLTMGATNGSIRITTNASGELESAKIVDRGAGYHTGGVITVSNTLGGAAGQLTYTVANGRLDTISVTAIGSGYTASSVAFLAAGDLPVATATDATGTGFELNLATANERGVTLWDDNTITSGAGAGAYIEGDLAAAVSRSNKAERPILEFKRDLDMYDMGWRYLGSVDVAAATEDFSDIVGQAVGLQVDGVTLETGMRLIFLDPDSIVTFIEWDEVVGGGDNTPVPPGSDWDATPWESSGSSGAVTRFVWEVDADGATIQLNKYDLINDVQADVNVEIGDVVTVTSGETWAGYDFYNTYDDDREEYYWRAGQQKFGRNQPMLYSLYDTSGIKLDDELEYPDSTFRGSEIFSYKVLTQDRLNELGGGALVNDAVLGFPLETKGFRQLGDVIFENDLETQRETYEPVGESETEIRGYYYFRQYIVDVQANLNDPENPLPISEAAITVSDERYQTNWLTSSVPEEQRVIDRYLTETDTEDTFPVSVRPDGHAGTNNTCLVAAQGRRLNTSEFAYLSATQEVRLFNAPIEYDGVVASGTTPTFTFNIQENFQLTIDGQYQELGVDYTITSDTPGNISIELVTIPVEGAFLQGTNRPSGAPGAGEVVEILTCTEDALPDDSIGYFEIPNGLENNPNNYEILEQSWNEFTPHFTSIITEQDVYEGDAFGAGNNYRDTAKDGSLGTFALQSQAPLLKTMLCASNNDLDIVDSIRFSASEYTRFKNKYIKTAQQLLNEGFKAFSNANPIDTSEWVDEILRRVTRSREHADAFKDTYMIAWNNVYEEQVINAPGLQTLFTTTNFVDLTDKKNVMYVYVDGVIQVLDVDYEITNLNPIQINLTTAPDLGAELVIRLYANSAPAHIPATPTKLGLYPSYRPRIETDDTYITPADVIIGHDGSRTPIYGNEIDQLLLELETRIYNGIIDKFRVALESGDTGGDYNIPLKVDTYKPGKFRETRWDLDEWNDLIKQSFYKWSAANRTDYITNNYYNATNEWTYNYGEVLDVDGEQLPAGYWRGIFDYYYDTQTPESTPWEMLGFTEKPIWWEVCTPRIGDTITGTTTDFTGYGAGPWPSDHFMWEDIEDGLIRRVYDPVEYANYVEANSATTDTEFPDWVAGSVDERYVRPNLVANYLPVDTLGALKADPLAAIDTTDSLIDPSAAEAQDDYTWGDWSPIEYAWRTSESYPFAAIEALFLARPGEFGEQFWDPEHIYEVPVDREQVVNDENDLRKRIGNSQLYVHGEPLNDVLQVNTGYQVWITSRLRTLKKDPSVDFGALIRTLDVKLGHKMAGFTDKDALRVFVEGISVSSAATNLLIPSENIDVALYTGAPANDYFYGGVLIKALSSDTYQIFGYDVLKGQFDYYERNDKVGTFSFNVGGQPEEFSVYENGTNYQAGDIVKLNGIFYRAKEAHQSVSFDPNLWTKLGSLPVTGGLNGTWKPNNTGNLLTLKYGEKLSGTQAVLDFLAGWNDYQEEQGWTFDETGGNGEINDWLKVSKDYLLWVGSQWEEGSLIMLSPGGEKSVLNAQEGYPGSVEKVINGVYAILNKEGVAIDPINTVINREDRMIEVEPNVSQTGIYGLRVSTYETENIITFDNVTVFNDIIYDPVLGSRLARLDFRGRRTLDWTGKLEAAGFIITADGLLPNYENMVDSIRNYHNTEVQLDTPQIENTARHLIGFDEREYFTDLGILDDAQFQFYQGLVRQKGTRQAIEKLERNANVTSINDELNVIEEWALKVGEFGGVCKNQFTEFLIAASEVKVDPQLVQLSYPASNSVTRPRAFASSDVNTAADTITIEGHGFRTGDGKTYSAGAGTVVSPLTEGSVYYVVVVDADTINLATTWANATADVPTIINIGGIGTGTSHNLVSYPSGRVSAIDIVSSSNTFAAAPLVYITNHPDDLTGNGASATAVLDTDGTLLRIDVLNPGSGYSEPPIVSIGNPSIVAGADRAIARIEYDIATDIASDDVIVIDIDDETRWITKPAGTACDVAAELWPDAPEEVYRTTNAGYVHKNDITFTAFNRAAVDNIINNTTTPFTHGQTVWIARDPRETFGVYFMDNYRASTIDAQTQANFDNTGNNGTWSGGTGYANAENIVMSDGSVITVNSVDGSGSVLTFTVTTVSTSPFPARGNHTLTAVSSNLSGNNDFTLTLGINNEESGSDLTGTAATVTMTGDGTATLTSLPREDVIKAQFTIDVSGSPTGDVTGVTVTDGGFGYKTGGTFTISRNTYGDERSTNDTDAEITYYVEDGRVADGTGTQPAPTISNAGSGYGRNVNTVSVNSQGSGYSMGDSLTLTGGTLLYGAATFDVTELTTIATQDEANFDGIPANEGSFTAGTGHAAGDIITMSDGSTITVDAATVSTIRYQTDANFDGAGSNGSVTNAGGGYQVGEVVTMQDGTVIQVLSLTAPSGTPPVGPINTFKIIESSTSTTVNSGDTLLQASTTGGGSGFILALGTNNEQTTATSGIITNFTITTASTTGITEDNTTLTQSSTDGLGVDFSLTLGTANQGVNDVTLTFKGSYSTTTPGATNVATTVLPAGGTGATLDLTYTGTGIVVETDDVTAPIGWGRYLGNAVPGSGTIFAGGKLYDYEVTSGLNVNLTKDGTSVLQDEIVDNTPFYTLMNVRFSDITERTLFADVMQLNGVSRVWTDDNGSGVWEVSNITGFTNVATNSASALLTVADNVAEGTIVGYEGLPDVIVPEPFEIDIDDGTSTETFRVTMFNDHGQGSGFEIELTDFSAPYNSPLFEDISSIEINHVGETGFNISNATLESSFNASTLNSPFASFGEYGFKMYVIDPSTNGFRQYSLSTAFDTTTATLDGSYDIDTAEAGMQFGFANQHETIGTQRGQSFYTFGTTSNRLRRWFTPTDWDLSTATPDTWLSQSEDVSGWTETPNLNGGAFFILDRGVGVDMYWLDGANTQIQHWANKLNEIQDVTQAGKAANIDLSTLTNFNWGFPRSMTMADGGNKLIILDDNYNASGNSYLCEIPLNTRNDPSSFSASAPEKVRLLSDIYGTETAYQPHISGYYNEKYFILCGDSTDNVLVFNAAVPAASPLVLNTIDVGSGGDLDHGGSTEGVGYLYLWFPTSGGYWGNDDIGLTYSVTINTGDAVLTPTASTTRTEDNLIETDKFENAYVYEEETKDTLAQIPVYDPFKGILPGNVAQNIKYIRQRDPARYTNASSTRLIDEDLAFDGDQLGQLWWDTSTSAYLYYEQGTDIYRRDNWGKLFPGSSVDIYEWTRHTGTPDSWTGDGTVRNTTDYVQLQEWDPILEEVRTFYYFWVKNRTQVPNGIGRTVAAFEVANIITNPIANLYQWFSPISQSAFMFAGVDNVFTDSNNIFQINYRRTDDERPTHVEWELGRDSDVSYEINDTHWNKMVDSLCGFTDEIDIAAQAYTNIVGSFNTDSSGIDTPGANNITTLTPHGLTNGAGVVYSKNGGTENIGLTEGVTYYVEVISDSVFALHAESQQAYPLPPVLVNPATRLPVFTSGAEVHTVSQSTAAPNNFANAIPTAADATRGYLVVPDPALSETQKLGIRTRPMQSMFLNLQDARRVWRNKVNELTNDLVLRDLAPTWNASLTTNNLWEWVDWYADGYDANNTVPVRQVDDTSDLALLEDPLDGDLVKVTGTRYSVYEFDAENDIYNLVAREASRLNILTDVYTSDQSLEIAIEIREIIEALRTNVFTGDLFVYNNSVFFAMLNYVFSEQDDLDWAFKTTYIFLDQTGRTLEQDRVFQEDPFDAALEYITEAKPYHSKVRDFRITRRTATDTAPGTAEENHRVYKNTILPYDMTVNLVYDQIRGGDLSVTEMRIAKYMMSLDTSWKGYTTLYDTDGTSVAVRLGAAGRAVSNYSEVLGDIQGPSGGTKATFDVTIIAGLLANVTLTSPGSGYENGTGFTFNLLTTQGGGDGFAEITYDVVNGQVTNPSVTDGGFGYNNGTNVPVDADDVPTPNVGTTLAEFNPIFTGVATTEDELVAVSVINAAITETFFFDYQGSFLRNTSFGGLPTLESFALASNPTGSGYVVGEILSLDAGSGVPVSNALFRVEQVDGGGGITLLSLVNGGSYTQTPTVDPVNLNGGSGTGAQVTTLIFENGSAVPWDSTPYDQIGFESSSGDDSVTALTGSPDGLATTIPGQTASDYDGTGENGSFVAGAGFAAGAANSGSPYPSGLTFADNAPALDTISRSDGNSFVTTDGMEAGMQIIVSNATEASNNGTYTIDSVTDTVITLATNSQVVDSVSDITATFTFHDVVGMSDGTDVRVDTVDGSGAITQFTIINGSESFLPSNSTITQLSVSGGTGSGFQLTLGEANETSGTFADVPAEETFSGTGNQKEFTILTDTPTFFMFAVVDGVQQVLNVDYFFIGDTLTFVSILDTNGQRAFGAPPAGTDNVELYTYIEAGDLINPQVTAGITEEMVPLDPRENLVLLADTTSVSLTAGGTGYNVNDEIEVVGGTRLQSTIAAQTETDFDGAGNNGTFDGGLGFRAGDTIRLVDTTEITVGTVDGSGTVLTFTIATASGRGFLTGSVINQDSTSNSTTDPIAEDAAEWDTGTGFQLLPGANNEADFGNPMTIRVDTEAANVITGFTVLDQGDYFTYPTSPVSTQTAGAGGAPDSFILAQTTDEDGVAGVTPYQYTSNADQTSWVERAITETDETDANQRYGMAYDGTGTWVSVGEGDLQGDFVTVLESTFTSTDDGVTWVPRTTADQNEMYDVAYGAGLFVAVGFGGDIETSPDGITWTSRTSGVANSLHSIHWTGSEFIAVGEGDILTSANGITWAATATKPGGGSTYFYAVTSNGSRWFVGTDGFGASRTAYYSDNSGATWNLPTGAVAASGDISGIATDGSSTVVVVGTDGDVLRSTDNGASYTDVTANVGTQESLNDVIYDYGATSPIGFVVGGWTTYPAGDAFISTSLDGSTWTTRVNTSTTNNGILSLAGKNPVPVAGGSGATFTLASHSFKLHNDTLNNLVFTRNTDSASTTLRSNVGTTDNVIPVAQGENLYTTAPSRQDPQIAWIGTERIVYHGVTATKEATFTIDTDGAGAVSAVALVSGGTGYTDGTGFTFTVTTATGIAGNDDAVIEYDVVGGIVTNPSVNTPGTGYTISQTGVAVSATDTNDPDVAVWELTGVIRGSSGTHPQRHWTGDKVFDGGSDQDIPVSPYIYWVNSATASYASGTFDGEWRYHGNNLAHFVLETAASTIHTTNSIVVGDTLRCTSGSFIQNSYFVKDLIAIGEVSKLDITDAGTGYSKGDVISTSTLDSGAGLGPPTTPASLVIEEVDSNGAILVVSILDRGTGYSSGSLNFVVNGGNGDATITVYTDREGLALAQGGDIISPSGVVVTRNNVSWAADRALPGGLLAATTSAAAFIQAEAGNALPVPAS